MVPFEIGLAQNRSVPTSMQVNAYFQSKQTRRVAEAG
jgi:hypothetical protein